MEKVVSFCGIERGEFVYYMAALLSKEGKAVLVVDNSFSNDIYDAVGDYDQKQDFVVKQNITYVKNANYNRDNDGIYDFALIWHGMNIDEDELMQSDAVFLLPNYTPACLKALNQSIKNKEMITAVFLRDSIESNKITEKSVAEFLEIPLEKIAGYMVFDARDYENYLAFLYNGRQTFQNLTPSYNECLKLVAENLLELNRKEVEKLFRKTKKAKTY